MHPLALGTDAPAGGGHEAEYAGHGGRWTAWTASLGMAALLAFVVLAALVHAGGTTWLDSVGRPLTVWAATHGLVGILRLVETAAGPTPVVVLVLALAAVLAGRRRPAAAVLLVTAVPATTLVTTLAKLLLARERPPWQLAPLATDPAFPSGHTSAATALAVCAVLVAAGFLDRPAWTHRRRVALGAVAAVFVVAVGLDRVLLGRHYPTDVLGGLLLGAAVPLAVAVVITVVTLGVGRHRRPRPPGGQTGATGDTSPNVGQAPAVRQHP